LYIFKSKDNELYQSYNGNIVKGKWEFIVDSNSLVIESEGQTELFNTTLLENEFLFLKKDGDSKSLGFANYTKYKDWMVKEIYKRLKNLDVIEETPVSDDFILHNTKYPIIIEENLLPFLDLLKINLKNISRFDFNTAVDYVKLDYLSRINLDVYSEGEVEIKELARFLKSENSFRPLLMVFLKNSNNYDYLERLREEVSGYLDLRRR